MFQSRLAGERHTMHGVAEGKAAAANIVRAASVRSGDPSAPTTTVEKEAAKGNRFAGMFGAITFKAVPERKPYVFEKGSEAGTSQTTVADVILENVSGIPGANYTGYRVVKRISADKKKVKCVVVSPAAKIGPMTQPYLSLKEADQDVKDEYSAFLQTVLGGFYSWAEKRQLAGIKLHDGKSLGGMSAIEEEIDADRVAALGL